MRNIYPVHYKLLAAFLFFIALFASCKKDNSNSAPPAPAPTNYATIGLYEYSSTVGSDTYRRVFVNITAIGTNTGISYAGVFDTGSTGMTMDATGLIPASMINSNGFVLNGADSVNVNGITITNQASTISYGGVGGGTIEYGNLAYATVTISDPSTNLAISRIPFFLYYKAVDQTTGNTLAAHSNDVFGVGPGTSYNSSRISSPLSYFKLGTGVTNGFRLALFNSSKFSATAPLDVAGLLTIGLISSDLNSSGFIMHPLTLFTVGGYGPDISGTINYNGRSIPATILFDTGTPEISIIEDPNATSNVLTIPANSNVTISTSQGFSYQYTTTSTYNISQVEKTSYSGDIRSIFSIDFFISNEYLLDYTDHQIGLKNN